MKETRWLTMVGKARNDDPPADALDRDCRRNRHDANAGLGIELLPPGNSRRPDRGGARRPEIAVFRILFRLAAASGRARADDRKSDRSAWRAWGARPLEHRARGGTPVAGLLARPGRPSRGLGRAWDRHG